MELIKAMQFILKVFAEMYPHGGRAIQTDYFFKKAKEAGVYKGGYGEPISKALSILTDVETISTPEGEFAYTVFKLKENAE